MAIVVIAGILVFWARRFERANEKLRKKVERLEQQINELTQLRRGT